MCTHVCVGEKIGTTFGDIYNCRRLLRCPKLGTFLHFLEASPSEGLPHGTGLLFPARLHTGEAIPRPRP